MTRAVAVCAGRCLVFLGVYLFLVNSTLEVVAQPSAPVDNDEIRWASSGGGWRSMVVNMAFANVFARAALMDSNQSRFTAISSTSGGSWFTTQLFFSPTFYNQVVSNSTSITYNFIVEWLQSYQDFIDGIPRSPACFLISPLEKRTFLADASTFCDVLDFYNSSYAYFIDGMLRQAATNYGDPSFPDRKVTSANRVLALQNTDLYIQTSVAANARYSLTTNGNANPISDINFVGPSNAGNNVFSIPLATQFVVQQNASFFQYAVEPSQLPLRAHWSTDLVSTQRFRYEDWYGYYVKDPTTTSASIYASPRPRTNFSSVLSVPFNGNDPNVVQIAAPSSAFLSGFASGLPSILAQLLASRLQNRGLVPNLLERSVFGALYQLPCLTEGFAICSQWPNACGPSDAWFLDGGYTDGPSLAGNIGQYHSLNTTDLNQTLKVIVTNNNYYTDLNTKFLSYFSTPFNQGIAPGDFIWPPKTLAGTATLNTNPWRSMQIFTDYLDDDLFLAKFEKIDANSNITTAMYEATTLANPAFGVRAGQRVRLLLLQVNSAVPTNFILPSVFAASRGPLQALAQEILQSTELLQRIQAFVAS
jgi:hypothetical protein